MKPSPNGAKQCTQHSGAAVRFGKRSRLTSSSAAKLSGSTRRYIAENPIKASLRASEYAVGNGSRVFKVASALAEYLETQCG